MSLTLEPSSGKKIRINLDDYSYSSDLNLRNLLHRATAQDVYVLEEILYSSIKTSIKKLSEDTDLEQGQLLPSLNIWESCGLIKCENDTVTVDKELRKYFELEIERFEEDFEPGIDFFAQLLKKTPIHVLPIWYAIPRNSTNIFESIVEKYLHTPQLYQRHLSDLQGQGQDPLIKKTIDILFTSDSLEIELDILKQKLDVSDEAFFKHIMLLEFNLIACAHYKKVDERFIGYLTPFLEYKNYLTHLRNTECKSIKDEEIERITLSPFAYIEGLFTLIKAFKSKPFNYPLDRECDSMLKEALAEADLSYLELEELVAKLIQVQLITTKTGQILLNETSHSFISMKPESAALVLYRHPYNKPKFDLFVSVDKGIRECEKAATRLVGRNWVLLDEFLKGMIVPFSEEQHVVIKKNGRRFEYCLPTYSAKEIEFVRHIFTDWFEKVGVVETGFLSSKPVIRLSTLGNEIFS